MNRLTGLLLLATLFFASFTQAKPLTKEQVPEPLKPWISWVLVDNPELACPFLYNSYEQKRCSWPTQLTLDLSSAKGVFSINWKVYKDSWVSLPGDKKYWPLNVTVNGKPALVMDKNGIPSITATLLKAALPKSQANLDGLAARMSSTLRTYQGASMWMPRRVKSYKSSLAWVVCLACSAFRTYQED